MAPQLRFVCAAALLAFSVAVPLRTADDSFAVFESNAADKSRDAVLAYRMRGEIRLLLLWIGRDNVGGGRITIGRRGNPASHRWSEQIEVLFGSDPDRIPGKINRWGYACETSEWLRTSDESTPRLLATKFEGLMRRSNEKSIDQANKENDIATTKRHFRFDATESRVFAGEASSEIRAFSEAQEFHYRHPEALLSRYRVLRTQTPPQEREYLLNTPLVYDLPYGFLTGLSTLIGRITETHERQHDTLVVSRPWLTFVYNANPYRLEVLDMKVLKDFRLPIQPADVQFPDVARVQFRSVNIVKGTRTDFRLWLPLDGPFKGIPLRIALQPRWWLRLRLDLDLRDCRPHGTFAACEPRGRDAARGGRS